MGSLDSRMRIGSLVLAPGAVFAVVAGHFGAATLFFSQENARV